MRYLGSHVKHSDIYSIPITVQCESVPIRGAATRSFNGPEAFRKVPLRQCQYCGLALKACDL